MLPYDSPGELKRFLETTGLSLKKRFGQNFLINPRVRERILREIDPREGELLWEIGPGLGALTFSVLEYPVSLRCFEIDYGFVRILEEQFGGNTRFSLVPGDVLKTWRTYAGERPNKVFGNLPYSSGAALIADFLEGGFEPQHWIFMVQKEIAQRMSALPGSEDYSSFSVLCNTFAQVEVLFDVQPGSFFPRPQVISSVVRLTPPGISFQLLDRMLFVSLVRSAFACRRKTLQNALTPLLKSFGFVPREVLLHAAIDPACRGESLSPEQFVQLAVNLQTFKKESPIL
ncbi:MAG TPA: 16S rRNA (adenine(1518)-N(6)/adenine(1519)-N(6))-dimethyltransferase RsmA [Spirochaetales bacterium]|nr:16S rRNA (adenine(1518)-N(6)/adenine(1519)-N(6))-dimethyltransferase RsmA [Spirochaetales bacterium]